MEETFWIPIVAILSSVALPIGFGMYLGLRSIRSKHEENMGLIEKGIIPPQKSASTPNKYRSLRNGFLCIGIGLGLIVGLVAINTISIEYRYQFFMLAASILLFLGFAYVLFYLVTKDKDLDF